jgi:hypothetical protein
MLSGGAVMWTSKQQEVVALSTTKAEYVVVNRAGHCVVTFRQLMQDVHHRQHNATTFYAENDGAVKFANNPMASHMAKHIDIKHQCMRELVDAWTMTVKLVGTADIIFRWSYEGTTGAEAHGDI